MPLNSHSTSSQERPAAAVATKVFAIASTAPALDSRFEPALKPNQPTHSERGANHGQRQRMGRHGLFAEPDAAAEQKRADEARNTGVDVNDRPAREVESAQLEAETGLSQRRFIVQREVGRSRVEPNRVRDRDVNDRQPKDREEEHRRKLHPLRETANGESGGDGRKRHLEADINEFIEADADRESCRRRLRIDSPP